MSRKKRGFKDTVAVEFPAASAGARQVEDCEGDDPELDGVDSPVQLRRVRGGTTRHVDEWLHADAQIKRLIAKGKLG